MTGESFRTLIRERCGNARRFAKKVKMDESMISHIIHGRKRIALYNIDSFAEALKMTPTELEGMLKGGEEYDCKASSRCFRLESSDHKKVDTIRISSCI